MTAADDIIAENAKDKIQPGDVVVTYARYVEVLIALIFAQRSS